MHLAGISSACNVGRFAQSPLQMRRYIAACAFGQCMLTADSFGRRVATQMQPYLTSTVSCLTHEHSPEMNSSLFVVD